MNPENYTELIQPPEFPSSLEERMRVLSCVNSGVKTWLLLTMKQMGGSAGIDDLKTPFAEHIQRTGYEYTIETSQLLHDFIKMNFIEIGLIARVQPNSARYSSPIGYELTEAGYKYGIPAAMLSIYAENILDRSLYPILGNTSTSSAENVRSPMVRADIIRTLSAAGPLTYSSLVQQLQFVSESNRLAPLQVLVQQGIVVESKSASQLYHKEDLTDSSYEVILHACRQVHSSSLPMTVENIYTAMGLPQDEQLYTSVTKAVEFLAVNSLLPGINKMQYSLSPIGEKLNTLHIEPMIGLLNDTLPDSYDNLIEFVLHNFNRLSTHSIELYAPFARSTIRREFADIQHMIVGFMSTQSEPVSLITLAKALCRNPNGMRGAIDQLLLSGEIKKIRIGRKVFFTLT